MILGKDILTVKCTFLPSQFYLAGKDYHHHSMVIGGLCGLGVEAAKRRHPRSRGLNCGPAGS